MKPNQPSLYLYFVSVFITILFEIFDKGSSNIVYLKTIAIPLIFMYFFISNNYKIKRVQSVLFLSCFVGDILVMLTPQYSGYAALYAFVAVYLLLLYYILKDFRQFKISKKKSVALIVMFLFTFSILFLGLKLSSVGNDKFVSYVICSSSLAILSLFCFSYYIVKPTVAHFFLSLMALSFILGDLFFVVTKFYQDLLIFRIIRNTAHVLAYYFMARYFLIKNISTKRIE